MYDLLWFERCAFTKKFVVIFQLLIIDIERIFIHQKLPISLTLTHMANKINTNKRAIIAISIWNWKNRSEQKKKSFLSNTEPYK